MTDLSRQPLSEETAPCGNEECDKCNPLPRFKISTERLQWITHERKIKAVDEIDAMRIYNQGTAWPSSYDDHDGELLEERAPVVERLPPRDHKWDCWHRLRHEIPQPLVDALSTEDE